MADVLPTPPSTPFAPNETKEKHETSHRDILANSETMPAEEPLTIDAFLRLRARQMGADPIVAYPSSGINYVEYSPDQLNVFACRLAQHYAGIAPPRSSSADPEVTIAILGPSNLGYLITLLALTKLGHTVLFLSTRLSTVAYVSLLSTTGAKHLLIDQTFQKVATSVLWELPTLTVGRIADRHVFENDSAHNTAIADHLDPLVENTKVAWIIHSSGSTGLPKPIYQTHRAALKNYSNNMNMVGFITLPLFHAHGLSVMFRGFNARKKVMLYNASLPLAREYLLGVLRDHSEVEIFYGVPYALKILAETPEGIAALAKLKAVMSAGSACPDAVGDRLVANGVNLVSHYGTTETGQLMTSARSPDGDKDWNYLRPMPDVRPYLRWELQSDNIYELIVLDGLESKVASNRPDGSYATKDLFTPHPTRPHAWKYYARLDDTITLVNGEKAVPNLFEHEIRTNPNVAEAIIFGAGKPRLGMMVIPSAATEGFDQEVILGSILPSLEKANKDAPEYAQITTEMVRILPRDTNIPKTDKSTVIRARFYKEFETQIDAVYDATEVASGSLALSEAELQTWLHRELTSSMNLDPNELSNDTDFFSMGVDSLRAIQVRSTIVKQIDTGGHALGSNTAFDHPTINLLAAYLFQLRTGHTTTPATIEEQMIALITQYSSSFRQHTPTEPATATPAIVVTGATGSLGAHIVAQLSLLPTVHTIYCLVRATSPSHAHTRVLSSLRTRRLLHKLPLPSRRKIIALPSSLSLPTLGLSPSLYTLITQHLTCVIHSAWAVNFNMSLQSFAPQLASVTNLLTLSLSTPPPTPATFNFLSSVSTVASTPSRHAPESLPTHLTNAQNMGYAQSKLVAEHLCALAAERMGVNARILRIGQVVGDIGHGCGNWVCAEIGERPLWLSVDVVAGGVVEISLGRRMGNGGVEVLNVVNARGFDWDGELLPMLRVALGRWGVGYEEVGRREWLRRLRESDADAVANPPVKLLGFFEGKYGYEEGDGREGMSYDTGRARGCSPVLAGAPVIDQAFVGRCVDYWMAGPWKGGREGYEDVVAAHLSGEHGIVLRRG